MEGIEVPGFAGHAGFQIEFPDGRVFEVQSEITMSEPWLPLAGARVERPLGASACPLW